MLGNLFGAKAAKDFGRRIALEVVHLSTQMSRQPTAKANRKKSNKVDSIMKSIEKELERFRQEHRLNIYSKAQLGSAFKFALLDHGVDQQVAEDMTTWLLIRCK